MFYHPVILKTKILRGYVAGSSATSLESHGKAVPLAPGQDLSGCTHTSFPLQQGWDGAGDISKASGTKNHHKLIAFILGLRELTKEGFANLAESGRK